MSSYQYKYVILGGGLVAGYAAQEFAERGIQPGELGIISAENTLPYERPPLSKDFLAGEKTTEDILINEPDFYDKKGIEVRLDTAVTRVNFAEKRLYAADDTITYDKLLIATGARPRKLETPGADLQNIFYLRQVNDAKRIRQASQKAQQAVVVGGSFIGMEATSVLQGAGIDTTIIFPEERVWQSFFTPEMSAFFENYYRARGVTILAGQGIASFEGNGRLADVITTNGLRLSVDLAVLGIGVTPNSELFTDKNLQMADDGIMVNRFLETNLPDVYAAGDITRYKDVLYGRTMHVEHWDNAVAQGRHAACVMLGLQQPYQHVPYFFSDVFDLSYEFWGDTTGAARAVHRGEVANGRFSVWWLDENGRLLAAFVMNRPEEERDAAPKWIQSGKQLSESWLKHTETFES